MAAFVQADWFKSSVRVITSQSATRFEEQENHRSRKWWVLQPLILSVGVEL